MRHLRDARLQSFLAGIMVALPAAIAPGASAGPPAPTTAPPASGSLEVDGFRLGYRIEGSGPTALVIGSATFYPRLFSPALRDHLRLVFLDHRGFAPFRGHDDPGVIELGTVVDDMERARQALGLGKVIVIGHSGHSYMALEYAKKYPGNVSHVIMIGISPDLGEENWAASQAHWRDRADSDRKAALAAALRRMPDGELAKLPPGERFVKGYVREAAKGWYDPRFDPTPLWQGVHVNVPIFEHLWNEVFRDIDITRGLESLDRPVWLALGRYDFVVAPPSSWERVRPRFRDVTIRVFERSGHSPPFEEPALFDAALLRWLQSHP